MLANDESFCSKLRDLTSEHHISQIVVGWPAWTAKTRQTRYVENFISKLDLCGVPVVRQDEADVRSGEAELKRAGKTLPKATHRQPKRSLYSRRFLGGAAIVKRWLFIVVPLVLLFAVGVGLRVAYVHNLGPVRCRYAHTNYYGRAGRWS